MVFPVLHGEAGEDGALREVFDLLGVPFVGSISSACRLAFEKSIDRHRRRRRGHPNANPGRATMRRSASLAAKFWSRRLVTRSGFPRWSSRHVRGSAPDGARSLGAEELGRPWSRVAVYGSVAVIEEFIEGTEVTVAGWTGGRGPIALPAVEIRHWSRASTTTRPDTPQAATRPASAELEPDVTNRAPMWHCACMRRWACGTCPNRSHRDSQMGSRSSSSANASPGMTEPQPYPWRSKQPAGVQERCVPIWSTRPQPVESVAHDLVGGTLRRRR